MYNCLCCGCCSSSNTNFINGYAFEDEYNILNNSIFSDYYLGKTKITETINRNSCLVQDSNGGDIPVTNGTNETNSNESSQTQFLSGSIENMFNFDSTEYENSDLQLQDKQSKLRKGRIKTNSIYSYTKMKYKDIIDILSNLNIVQTSYNNGNEPSIFGDNSKFMTKVLQLVNSGPLLDLQNYESIDLSLMGIYISKFGNDDDLDSPFFIPTLDIYKQLFISKTKDFIKKLPKYEENSLLVAFKHNSSKITHGYNNDCIHSDTFYNISYTFWITVLFMTCSTFVLLGNQIPNDLSIDLNWISLFIRIHMIFIAWSIYILYECCLYNSKLMMLLLSMHKLRLKIRLMINSNTESEIGTAKYTENDLLVITKDVNNYNEGSFDYYIPFNFRKFIFLCPLFLFPLFIKSICLVVILFCITVTIQLLLLIVQNKYTLGRIDLENYLKFIQAILIIESTDLNTVNKSNSIITNSKKHGSKKSQIIKQDFPQNRINLTRKHQNTKNKTKSNTKKTGQQVYSEISTSDNIFVEMEYNQYDIEDNGNTMIQIEEIGNTEDSE